MRFTKGRVSLPYQGKHLPRNLEKKYNVYERALKTTNQYHNQKFKILFFRLVIQHYLEEHREESTE